MIALHHVQAVCQIQHGAGIGRVEYLQIEMTVSDPKRLLEDLRCQTGSPHTEQDGMRVVSRAHRLHHLPDTGKMPLHELQFLPGLIQSHIHLCQTLMRGLADDLRLLDWLRKRVWPLEAAHTPATLRLAAELGCAELLLGGTTAILDMGTVHHHDEVFAAGERAGIHAVSGKAMMDVGRDAPGSLKESTGRSLAESDALRVRWDWANDGVYDTTLSTVKTIAHRLGKPTLHTVRLQVWDTNNLTDETTQVITLSGADCEDPEGSSEAYLPLLLR